jgi:hypothetical protein
MRAAPGGDASLWLTEIREPVPPLCVPESRIPAILEPTGRGHSAGMRGPPASHANGTTYSRKHDGMRVALDDGTLPPAQDADGYYAREDWDGKTRHSKVPELRYPYTRTCFLCARHPPIEWLTNDQARALCAAGLGRCEVCRGWRYLDLQEVGDINSPARAAPARPEVEAAAWPVPRRSHHAA